MLKNRKLFKNRKLKKRKETNTNSCDQRLQNIGSGVNFYIFVKVAYLETIKFKVFLLIIQYYLYWFLNKDLWKNILLIHLLDNYKKCIGLINLDGTVNHNLVRKHKYGS